MKKLETLVIGHRGASGLVEHENTIEAFQKAIEVGCNAIECDIRKTKDDILVINHDPHIKDLVISEHTYQELNDYTLSLSYHLPTLIETLEFVKGKILIDLEIKEIGYEEKILSEVLSVLSIDEFFIRSFYDEVLIKIHSLNKDIRLILLTGVVNPKHLIKTRFSEVFPRRRLKKCGAYAVSPYYKELILNYANRLRRLKYPVIVWTVNDEEYMVKLNGKVAGIITNYPDKLKAIINEKKKV